MDEIRRAKLNVLVPILTSVHEAVRDLMDQEQVAFHTTPANLKGAQPSEVHSLDEAEAAIDHAIDCLKDALGGGEPLKLSPATLSSFKRRV